MLHGRESECSQVSSLLAAARAGNGGALVLRGEPGIGKSALLDFAASAASGMRVVRGAGVESESELPFAAVHQLLGSLPFDNAPPRQRDALLGAFGQGPAVSEDRFLISLAVLSVLSDAAPLLCLVDDAQWLDGASADALTFAARRVTAEPIAFLFAARSFAAQGLPSLSLEGISPNAASGLLPDVAPQIRDRLVAETLGNPLALTELARSLTPAQLAGTAPLPTRLPVVADLFLDQVRGLPSSLRTLLLIAAADDTGSLRVVLDAAIRLGVPSVDFSDLLTTNSDHVSFRHPLLRSAVYEAASLQERRAALEALASVLDSEEDSDRRAWHLANAAVGPDETVADALHRSAHRARQRGGHAAAATAYTRAAALTSSLELRAARLTDAAAAAWDAGTPDRTRALLDEAGPLAVAPRLRARIAHLRGRVEYTCGVPAEAYALLVSGASLITSLEPEQAARMLTEASQIAWGSGDLMRLREAGHLLESLSGGPIVPLGTRLVTGLTSFLDGDTATAAVRLRETADLARATDEPRGLMLAAAGAMFMGSDSVAIDLFTRAVVRARSESAAAVLPALLAPLAALEMWTGRFATASAHASEGLSLAEETAQANPAAHHRSILAWIAAVEGRTSDCTSHASVALAHAIEHRLGPHAAIASWSLALLDLGAGRHAAAFDRLSLLASPGEGHQVVRVFASADLVEAAVRTDHTSVASEALQQLSMWASHSGATWARALVARCQALVSDSVEDFDSALELHAVGGRPFDTARTQLLYGAALRRRKRRADARGYLEAAHETFARLGAVPWAMQAETELRATGAVARKRDPSTVRQLTPQELQIARMVADGATNRTVASQLFLSPRTVDYHLSKVFTKLGLSSRAELMKMSLLEDAL